MGDNKAKSKYRKLLHKAAQILGVIVDYGESKMKMKFIKAMAQRDTKEHEGAQRLDFKD